MVVKNFRALFRFAALLTMTGGIYAVWFVGAFFVSNKMLWRQAIFTKWASATAKIAKMRIEVRGRLPRPPFFLVSNHLSYMDVAAFRCIVNGIFLAKSEVENWFFVGSIVSSFGTIFINRNNRRDILRAGREIVEQIERGESLIVFPEGTSTAGQEVLPFKSPFLEFAVETNSPVSYASISYRTADKDVKPSKMICWWEDISFARHLWRLFQIETFTAIIVFGDRTIQNPDRKNLAAELHNRVSENFVPVL